MYLGGSESRQSVGLMESHPSQAVSHFVPFYYAVVFVPQQILSCFWLLQVPKIVQVCRVFTKCR